MRSEQEMMELILGIAREDARIRAVGMNGSRTNPNAPKDPFQDYDIVYVVTDVGSFTADHSWVDVFGERIIMQIPDLMEAIPSEPRRRFGYLMQFTDGNRIDLTLVPVDEADTYSREDKLTLILMDKDNCIPAIPAPTDEEYWVKPPSAKTFADVCNEFWWVAPYVAKGLWRQEVLYAQKLMNIPRDMLLRMLEWRIGTQTDFSVSAGKCSKYLEKYLDTESWQALLSTYADGDYENLWNALFNACELFRTTAKAVAEHFGYEYAYENDRRVTAYLRRIQAMPADAREIF